MPKVVGRESGNGGNPPARLELRRQEPAAANPAALPYHATMEAYRALEAELIQIAAAKRAARKEEED